MIPDDDRTSDEATGLPPLHEIDVAATIVLLAWDATEGMVSMPNGESIAVRYLHVRGVTHSEDGTTIDWAQAHIAVPVDVVMEVAGHLVRGTTEEP